MKLPNWIVFGSIGLVIGVGIYGWTEYENAKRGKLRADTAVRVLPPGVEQQWRAYVDRQFDEAIQIRAGAFVVRGLLDLAVDRRTYVSLNMPYKVTCDPILGGSVEFGFGEGQITVPIWGPLHFRKSEAEPELGVIKSSIAARSLADSLCEGIALRLRRMTGQ